MKLDFREQTRYDAVYAAAFVHFAAGYDNSVDPAPAILAHAYATDTAEAAISAMRRCKGMTTEQMRELRDNPP